MSKAWWWHVLCDFQIRDRESHSATMILDGFIDWHSSWIIKKNVTNSPFINCKSVHLTVTGRPTISFLVLLVHIDLFGIATPVVPKPGVPGSRNNKFGGVFELYHNKTTKISFTILLFEKVKVSPAGTRPACGHISGLKGLGSQKANSDSNMTIFCYIQYAGLCWFQHYL